MFWAIVLRRRMAFIPFLESESSQASFLFSSSRNEVTRRDRGHCASDIHYVTIARRLPYQGYVFIILFVNQALGTLISCNGRVRDEPPVSASDCKLRNLFMYDHKELW